MISLHPMTDRDFAWLLGAETRADGLTLCDGGIAPDEVTAMLRGIAAEVAATTAKPVAWLIADGNEVVGMTSFTKFGADGRYEIGYGIAPAHEGRGVMTRAMAALLPIVTADGHGGLTAGTSVDNPGSQRVLEKNGFVRTGTRDDPEDGALITWAIDLSDKKRAA
ncbi:MAG: GCN5-related N-acetyltransferase [Sphingomonas bacterium]|jgi:RimJ/RimL family protein N-acetyltransferase|uniref:GNAT family N-acetyltransferase n=1 Tax=Sphingomonas bacterium TaxID=1895847 RepID=UPI002635A068|nr:GNAT family N-acetyltransferase [Sphingomonas bacterium]MDB5703985.1 GCN5-related N-acetyltransferase [Sphingomonas bacterium]